jgi:hypothetical protein
LLTGVLAAGTVGHGRSFNPLIMLEALSYFDDLPRVPQEVREWLRAAVETVDPGRLPMLTTHMRRDDDGRAMKALPITPELLRVVRRFIWFEEPERALADPVQFLAHAFGTVEDLKALHGIVGKDEFREVLEQAPPGIFDARSWAYWNLVCGHQPAPPLPVRTGLLFSSPMQG